MKPTGEQQRILDAFKSGENLVIDARAGTGKTMTLQMIAQSTIKPMLYLAFNKKMADEAAAKFPMHVSVMTTHALAYRAIGHEYRHKLSRPRGAYVNVLGTGGEVARELGIDPFVVGGKLMAAPTIGYAVLNTLKRFESSADAEIMPWHSSTNELTRRGIESGDEGVEEYRLMVFEFAEELWHRRIDKKDVALATHDTYLKLFQLSKPELPYGTILLDEAQDSNPCLLDIVLSQQGKQVIVVGDEYQSIYQWRGAVNALAQLPWRKERLTKSFRFGAEAAELARVMILDDDMKPFLQLTGNEAVETDILAQPGDLAQATYVYRTNSALLLAALSKIEEGKAVEISIDIRPFAKKLDAAMALREGRTRDVKHPDIMLFESWHEFEEDGEFRDPENRHIANIINADLYGRVSRLIADYKKPVQPDFIFVTAHKSKGLEWENVILGDDFATVEVSKETGKWRFTSEGERNLLYVAVTRVQRALVQNSEVVRVKEIGAANATGG